MSQTTTGSGGASTPNEGMADRATHAADTAKQEASTVADSARAQAGDVAHAAGEQARAVVDDAKHQAHRVVDESRQHLRQQASEQTSRFAGTVRDVSQQLEGVSRGQAPQPGLVADLAGQAAGYASQLADQLEGRSPEELLADVRRFARQRPGMFLLGALGAGFVAGRLVRSVDTQSIVDAAKSGASGDDGQGSPQHASTSGSLPAGSSTGSTSFPEELTPAVRP